MLPLTYGFCDRVSPAAVIVSPTVPVVVHPKHDELVFADERPLRGRDGVVRLLERLELILVAEERRLVCDDQICAGRGGAL